MKKRIAFALSLILVFVSVTAISIPASADNADGLFVEGTATGRLDGSVFSAGETAGSDAEISGILFAAGRDVNAGGRSEYAMAAGYGVRLSGSVENDAFLAGNTLIATGSIDRDLFAAGNNVSVTGTVGRSLYVYAQNATITGNIGGDVYISAENITVSDGAEIGGKLHYNEDSSVSAPKSVISNAQVYIAPGVSVDSGAAAAGNYGTKITGKLISYIGLVALAFVLLWLTPLWETVDKKYYAAPFGVYARAFGTGFAVLAALPVAAIFLMLTRIGVRLAFVLLLVYAAAITASLIFLGFFLGALLWRRAFGKAPCYWAELPIGLLLCCAAKLVPGLSFATGFVSVPLGLGVITLLLGKGKSSPSGSTDAAPALPSSAAE